MSRAECKRKSEVLQAFLDEEAEQVGRESGFVQRQSKLSGAGFAKTVVLGWLGRPEATLNELVQSSDALGIRISESGLHQRLNEKGVAFLAGLLARSLVRFQASERLPAELLKPFSQVNLLDSSLVTLPASMQAAFAGSGMRGCAAAAKLQLNYEYLTGTLTALDLQAGRTPDQKCLLPRELAVPGSLHLFDLGYFNQHTFQALDQAGAYFLSRLHLQIALYATANATQRLDLVATLQAQKTTRGELTVYLGYHTHLPVRLIFDRLPAPVVETRRRKARAQARKQGRTCSALHLALLEWALFITNVPVAWLSPDQILTLYPLRWQIELVFKLWKSQAKLASIRPWNPARILCQFYARLLGLVLFHWLAAPCRVQGPVELSLPKAFRLLQRAADALLKAIAARWRAVPALLQRLEADFLRFAPKSARHSSPSTYHSLLLAEA